MTAAYEFTSPDGNIYYMDDQDRLHRLDGPAIIYPNGYKVYYQHGIIHRLGGPARIYSDGQHAYYQNGRLHRLDGPAKIYANGTIQYWVDGEVPTFIMDLIITDREMIYNGIHVPEVVYRGKRIGMKAYRFINPDELTLAQLYYS
jgi:hypothetical protein